MAIAAPGLKNIYVHEFLVSDVDILRPHAIADGAGSKPSAGRIIAWAAVRYARELERRELAAGQTGQQASPEHRTAMDALRGSSNPVVQPGGEASATRS